MSGRTRAETPHPPTHQPPHYDLQPPSGWGGWRGRASFPVRTLISGGRRVERWRYFQRNRRGSTFCGGGAVEETTDHSIICPPTPHPPGILTRCGTGTDKSPEDEPHASFPYCILPPGGSGPIGQHFLSSCCAFGVQELVGGAVAAPRRVRGRLWPPGGPQRYQRNLLPTVPGTANTGWNNRQEVLSSGPVSCRPARA